MGGMTTSAISAEAEQTYRSLPLRDVLEDLSSRFIVNLPKEELGSITRIGFQVEQAHWFYEDFLRPINPSLPSLSLRNFSSQLLRTASHTVPLIKRYIKTSSNKNGIQDLEAAFEEFIMYKTRVPVCGIIIVNSTCDKCLLVKGWKSSSTWGFPKGKINQSEPKRDCAIREVYEETGFDCTELLKENSNDYMDLTMKDQKIRLYVVKGVDENTVFETRTRKEISKIAWFDLDSLPTWKKAKTASDISSAKFFMVSPFISRLKQWIKANKYRNPGTGSGGFGKGGGGAAGEDDYQEDEEGETSFEADGNDPIRAATPTGPAALRNGGRSSINLNSSSNPPENAPRGPAAERLDLHQQPTSEGLKALLGFSAPPIASSSQTTLDSPQAAPQLPVQHSSTPSTSFNPLYDGKGSNMIQQSTDTRSLQLLELLRGATEPSVNSENQLRDQQLNTDNGNGSRFGGSRAWEDVQREQESANLLAALRAGGQGSESTQTSRAHQNQQPDANQALLSLLNGNNGSNNMNTTSQTSPDVPNGTSPRLFRKVLSSSDPFNPYHSIQSSSQAYPSNHQSNLVPSHPGPAISPLPAPRAHNVALAQSLLKLMSPAQGSFSFAMPPASSANIENQVGGRNESGSREEIRSDWNQPQVDGKLNGMSNASEEEQMERERAKKRDALLASMMGGLAMGSVSQQQQQQPQTIGNWDMITEQSKGGTGSGNGEAAGPEAQAMNLLNLLNPISQAQASKPHPQEYQLQQQVHPQSSLPRQPDFGPSEESQRFVHQNRQAPQQPFLSPQNHHQSVGVAPPPIPPNSFPASPIAPLSDREQRLREAQERDRALNFKFPPSSHGSVSSSPQKSRSGTIGSLGDSNLNAEARSPNLLALLNNGAGGGANVSPQMNRAQVPQSEPQPPQASSLLNMLNGIGSAPPPPLPMQTQPPQFQPQNFQQQQQQPPFVNLPWNHPQAQSRPMQQNQQQLQQVQQVQGWIHTPPVQHQMPPQPTGFQQSQFNQHPAPRQFQVGVPPQWTSSPQMRVNQSSQPTMPGYNPMNMPMNANFPLGAMR